MPRKLHCFDEDSTWITSIYSSNSVLKSCKSTQSKTCFAVDTGTGRVNTLLLSSKAKVAVGKYFFSNSEILPFVTVAEDDRFTTRLADEYSSSKARRRKSATSFTCKKLHSLSAI